jgi:hypothetical protein
MVCLAAAGLEKEMVCLAAAAGLQASSSSPKPAQNLDSFQVTTISPVVYNLTLSKVSGLFPAPYPKLRARSGCRQICSKVLGPQTQAPRTGEQAKARYGQSIDATTQCAFHA